jgi:hypothetical protein
MEKQTQGEWFQNIEKIISEPLNFKAKLAIGEDAYTSLKVKNAAFQVWEAAGVATTAAVVAKSSVVASTFFAPTGFLAAIGLGTAVTPVGWVIAAGVVTGGAWVGITRYLKKASASRVTVIPKFINTPLDVLALGLFDLLAPLALKVSLIDGSIDDAKRKLIHDYFVKEWGYDSRFVAEGVKYTESRISEFSIKSLAQTLAEFTRENRDCNFKMMAQEILGFLGNIVAVDGKLDQRQQVEIGKIEAAFKSAGKYSFKKTLQARWGSIRQTAGKLLSRKKSAKDNE